MQIVVLPWYATPQFRRDKASPVSRLLEFVTVTEQSADFQTALASRCALNRQPTSAYCHTLDKLVESGNILRYESSQGTGNRNAVESQRSSYD